MNVVRQAGALLLAALVTSRGLFAQGAVDSPAADSTVVDLRGAPAITPADQLKVLLHPVEIRYVQQESRSEERRVGKEGRSRWWEDHRKKRRDKRSTDSGMPYEMIAK